MQRNGNRRGDRIARTAVVTYLKQKHPGAGAAGMPKRLDV